MLYPHNYKLCCIIVIMEVELKDLSKKINSIIEDENFSNKKFHLFRLIITKMDNLKTFQSFFQILQDFYLGKEKKKYLKPKIDLKLLNVKKFLSFFTILYYPDIMNSNGESIIFKNLKKNGNSMRIYFFLLLHSTNKEELDEIKLFTRCKEFFRIFNEYLNSFNEWKEMDKECLIYNLSRTYFFLEKDFEKEKRTEENKELYDLTKKNIKSEKEKTLEKILSLDRSLGNEKFLSYQKLLNEGREMELKHEEFIEKLVESFTKNMKKSFWDLMKKDLKKTPPDTNSFINNLKELINTIISVSPRSKNIRDEIINVIDVELIDQMIKHNAYRYSDLEGIVEYVNKLLWEYQAPAEDEITREYEINIKQMMDNRENIIDVLVYFMSFTMEKFENILLFNFSINRK